MESKQVILFQLAEIDKGTKEKFVEDLAATRTELGAHIPDGLIFSKGGFKVQATTPTFALLLGWKSKEAEEAFRKTPFYTSHYELFQKYSSKPIETHVVEAIHEVKKPVDHKCLEVWNAPVEKAKQAEFLAAGKKLEEAAPKIPGILAYTGGVTDTAVITFITWNALEDHENFKKSADFAGLVGPCAALSPKAEVYHVQL